ncbi:hypothetical protein IFM89_026433 [Coptis chinensis]|uniref:LRAT domain-containing protein n=1 Tax=Coptis chinensis TaxID=261450 RepID=A0A835HNY6_9MAGN|nr:hypothetical protein IFM89_026433 [Coptis chinensis]
MVKGWDDNFSSTEFRTSFASGNAVKEKRLRTDLVDIVNVVRQINALCFLFCISWFLCECFSIHNHAFSGIYIGEGKVVHFTPQLDGSSSMETSCGSCHTCSKLPSTYPTFPNCGFRQENSGVVLSCLNCFLGNGSLYCFEYGVTLSVFIAKVRGGTCTTATSDPPEPVIHRALYLLQNGFGNFDIFPNNNEDFALYWKTSFLVLDKSRMGMTGQACSLISATFTALLSSPLNMSRQQRVGLATLTAGTYFLSRYVADIGVRSDVSKVAVENLAVNFVRAAITNKE